MPCDVCGLPDTYRGLGDGIGSCDCTRCDCGAAWGSSWCTCVPEDWDDDWDDDEMPTYRSTEDVPTRGLL
ncbi:hypothetical protein [Streptomyces sp.]|uniref:hypothetical protein n=1 Tax=Streptomyces sp. TaxID=1931 RepID=UPI002F942CA5